MNQQVLETSPLKALAEELKAEASLLSSYVVDSGQPDQGSQPSQGALSQGALTQSALGALVAAGPKAAESPFEYAVVTEAIREGYLLHYGAPRLVENLDPDLALLAGDYLYALGLERLARLGDEVAVALFGDLISLAALCHREHLEPCVPPLWLASAVAIGCGEGDEIRAAKETLKAPETASYSDLWRSAEITANRSGIGSALLIAAKAIDFPAVN